MKFYNWLKVLKDLMVKTEIIKKDTTLDSDGYKPYFEEGITPYETLRKEFGMDWVKKYQKWYFSQT